MLISSLDLDEIYSLALSEILRIAAFACVNPPTSQHTFSKRNFEGYPALGVHFALVNAKPPSSYIYLLVLGGLL
jgi:hypothetical protein